MTDQRKQQSRNVARVFVLGSGFSASMGLPTQADLFDGLMNVPERGGERDQENLLLTLEALRTEPRTARTIPTRSTRCLRWSDWSAVRST